jgi:hypothetical protein
MSDCNGMHLRRFFAESGFIWTIILDGNTFITLDSWYVSCGLAKRCNKLSYIYCCDVRYAMKRMLDTATKEKKRYFKIPYHRVHRSVLSACL